MKRNTLLVWLLCLLGLIIALMSLYYCNEEMIGIMIIGAIESFVILPLHGKYLSKKCKKGNCATCKSWHCQKYRQTVKA